jgi:hypothetical protein
MVVLLPAALGGIVVDDTDERTTVVDIETPIIRIATPLHVEVIERRVGALEAAVTLAVS